jgi:hypothetical protein
VGLGSVQSSTRFQPNKVGARSRDKRSSRRVAALTAVAVVVLAGVLDTAAFAGATSWSGGTYEGHGTGVWPKNTVMLKVSANGKKIPTYNFSIDTLCGEKVGGVESARETEIWPFTSQGSPAIPVSGAGSFSSTQQGSFTVSAIPTVMPRPEPGTYRFTVSGKFSGAAFSGHLTLDIQAQNKYFCTDTNSPFAGTRAASKA